MLSSYHLENNQPWSDFGRVFVVVVNTILFMLENVHRPFVRNFFCVRRYSKLKLPVCKQRVKFN